jgi:hypothetical protein
MESLQQALFSFFHDIRNEPSYWYSISHDDDQLGSLSCLLGISTDEMVDLLLGAGIMRGTKNRPCFKRDAFEILATAIRLTLACALLLLVRKSCFLLVFEVPLARTVYCTVGLQ